MNAEVQTQTNASHPLVSIIIPCYNQAQFLDAAIQSVLDQTYPTIEIIVVDDGSTDATHEHALRYPTVHYLHQDNQGLSAARNTGTRVSHGEFLVFLDSDDQLLPEAVQTNAEYLQADAKLGFVAGHFRYINTDGSFQHENERHCIGSDYYVHFLINNFIGMHGAVMYRRAVIEAVGGFDSAMRACEDYDLYLRISRTYPIVCHGALLTEYRRHGQGISNNSALMLASATQILERERRNFADQSDRRLLAAYQRGRTTWRNRYGRELLIGIVDSLKRGQLLVASVRLRDLLPHIPAGLFWIVRRTLPTLMLIHTLGEYILVVQ